MLQDGRTGYYNRLFADDRVLTADDEEGINCMVRNIPEEFRKWRLEINIEKAAYISTSI